MIITMRICFWFNYLLLFYVAVLLCGFYAFVVFLSI